MFIVSVGVLMSGCTECFIIVISFNIHSRPGRQALLLCLFKEKKKLKFRVSNLPKRKIPDVNLVVRLQRPGRLVFILQ